MMNIKIPNDKKEELVAQIQQFFMEEEGSTLINSYSENSSIS